MDIEKDKLREYVTLLYKRVGINISDKKRTILEMKIKKVMRHHNIDSYDDYLEFIQTDENFQEFLDYVTTNITHFFREREHFDYIKQHIEEILIANPRVLKNKELRIWSAGCSTGQEPVSIAIALMDILDKNINIKILATDLSSKVLRKAMSGIYTSEECAEMSKENMYKYFEKTKDGYTVKSDILKLITYRKFNLMNEFKFKKGFDIIFCRNVMIYFDNSVQEGLINRFYEQLAPGGLLIIGKSESLINKKNNYNCVGPSIYQK